MDRARPPADSKAGRLRASVRQPARSRYATKGTAGICCQPIRWGSLPALPKSVDLVCQRLNLSLAQGIDTISSYSVPVIEFIQDINDRPTGV
jgi:hypothetical protein